MVSQAVFDIRCSEEPGPVYRFDVRGELDAETIPRLITSLRLARGEPAGLRLDLSGVTFIDCGALSFLLAELRSARRQGWEVEVDQDVSRPVRRLIQLTQVDPLLWP